VLWPLLDKFTAYRLPSALFLALVVTAMYVWMTEVFDRATGLLSAAAVLLMPNLFGHAHFAMTDMPLAALWFLAAFAFWRGLGSWRWSVAFGVLWGFALATKLPGFLLPIPLILWAHLFRRQQYANNVFTMMFVGPPVMVVCNPYLWHHGAARVAEFLYMNASRAVRPGTDFPIFFLNEYHRSATLPWYYGLMMTALTVPETMLLLAVLGVGSVVWLGARREVVALFALNAGFVLGMALVPGAVLHDVNRLMLPVLPFLAGLAGAGFFSVTRCLVAWGQHARWARGISHLRMKVVGALCVLALVPPALELVAHHPYELSYYNRLVGGVRGAYAKGLEVTYLMEAFNPEFLKFLDKGLPGNAAINASFGNFMFMYYQRHGRLRTDIRITEGADFDYYILLNRPSAYPEDRMFLETRPVLHDGWYFRGVPLVFIFKARGG